MEERDFFREPLTEGELRSLLKDVLVAEAFAWRSPRARALSLDQRNPPADDELVRLMLEEPYLIRRPVIRVAGETVFGFDRRRLQGLVERADRL